MPLLLASIAIAVPVPAELAAAWQTFDREARSASSVPALRPTAGDWRAVAAGEIITYTLPARDELTPHMAALGYIDQPIESVWLAVVDAQHLRELPGVLQHELPGSTRTHRILYQHLDLPLPFTDRHWLIHVRSNGRLHTVSNGSAWERAWRLDDEGEGALKRLSPELRERGEGAIFTPVNEGGWLMVRAGFGTLIVYHLRTHIGGYIPPALVESFARSRFDDLIETVAEVCAELPRHYRGAHAPIFGPAGAAMATFGN
jgi:hypothetical protein